jgi:hypothetical protein
MSGLAMSFVIMAVIALVATWFSNPKEKQKHRK